MSKSQHSFPRTRYQVKPSFLDEMSFLQYSANFDTLFFLLQIPSVLYVYDGGMMVSHLGGE